jgi:hypothetical protein
MISERRFWCGDCACNQVMNGGLAGKLNERAQDAAFANGDQVSKHLVFAAALYRPAA